MSRHCQLCGAALDNTARFCENCGAEAAPRQQPLPQAAAERDGHFAPDATGKYHWYYELSLLKSPTVFITCMKVFGGIVLGMGIFIGLIGGDGFAGKLLLILRFWLYGLIGAFVLVGLGYFIYAAIQGFKYCIVFEMDEDSVTHTQLAKQFKKAQVISGLTVLMGASRGSLTMMGTGLLAGSRSSMETSFRSVRTIRVDRRRNVIYLLSRSGSNQIYAPRETFGAVLEYILRRIPDTAVRRGV